VPLPSRAEVKNVQALTQIERERLELESKTPLVSRILAFLACLVALWWAQAVLIPIVLSVLLSYGLEPLAARLESRGVRRAFAAPLLLFGFIVISAGLVYALRGEATAFVDGIPSAIHTVSQTIQGLSNGKAGTLSRMKDAAHELETAATAAAAPDAPAVRIEQPTFKWSDWLWQGSRNAAEFGGQMLFVLCLTYSLLAAGDLYKRRLVHLVPRMSDKKITVQILAEIDRQIERFLIARATISLIVGVAVAIGFHFAGMLEAGVWGVIAGILFVVPLVGPTLVLVLASLAAFVQFGSAGAAALIAALILVIGILEGNVLTPLLLRRVGEMNTAAVFVSLLFWGWIWGGWGLLLAVPITAAIKAVCERVPDLAAFAELLKA
jgi:predicted PurR-regulated permease PerM